jgi:hypothetical protein
MEKYTATGRLDSLAVMPFASCGVTLNYLPNNFPRKIRQPLMPSIVEIS